MHVHHGIGRFVGMLRLPVDGVEKDYIKIQYAGSDCLYVPATSLDLVSKYIGGGEETAEKARLNKLSGDQWAKTTRRAKAAARELAEGLIKLYAQRQRLGGFAFSPDSPWQQEFEDAFDYTETEDQLAAIRDIKTDMEKPVPMDRLLCGDVGYGKTEVALRAAMKCILDGKQAAILVPTTVLAQQHYATAAARFRAFPVTVEVLSRFRSPKQVKDILERTRDGRVDLLIGTHKLLSKNVQFKDLGLLIIDEEQRFGVTHKERLRQVAQQVDTLTLSATPIPRTLNMALSGIRDMSTIEQPPQDRQPVQTYVLEHDWGILAEAIRRELSRGGQVYYLHNRVDNIDATAARLRELLDDDAVVETAHGKMAEGELSRVMARMSEGEIDVLVCTTIIETGIDIPNVNTLIIEDADNMGLSQLHQIRGRIGRSARVQIHPLLGGGHIALRDVRRHRQVGGALHPHGHLPALLLQHRVVQQLQVHVVAHGHHVAGLLRPQQIARSADLQIPHGDLEAGAEFHILPYGGEPLGGHLRQHLAGAIGQIGIRPAGAAADAAPDLVQLGQAQPGRVAGASRCRNWRKRRRTRWASGATCLKLALQCR